MWTTDVSQLAAEQRIAIAIAEVYGGQRHVGILYRPAAGAPPRFLHLAWHNDLRDDETVQAKYRAIAVVDVPLALQPTIVSQCKRSGAADVLGLSYGFGYRPSGVERDPVSDRMVLRGPSGLTCATFVLAIFGLANVNLLDLDQWTDRAGDDEWKDHVIAGLERAGADPAHVEAVRNDRQHARVRPEDVGAGATSPLPAGLAIVVARGAALLTELQTL